MNIKEDYVSFEVAKLLKEKGFDGETEHKIWYVIKQFSTGCHWNSCVYKVGDMTREYDNDCCISMPTFQMALKWLREEKHFYIQIMLDSWALGSHLGYYIVIQDINSDFEEISPRVNEEDTVFFSTYEEAVEAAIKYTLKNLI